MAETVPAPGRGQHLCLSDLLDQDTSSYEYFYSQPEAVQRKIREEDPSSFEEMQEIAASFC
ncbi:MAG: hypothetical protein PHE09_02255 [Oscillospiraceae bacterium]|nr:hypothetical protein [Oscillospiraceae bacterium]